MDFFFRIFIIIVSLLNVAFVTLLERKILGLSQLRIGPNKVRMGGILQPFSDALKLISKEISTLSKRNWLFFYASPLGRITLILILWSIVPYRFLFSKFQLSGILIILILGLGIFPLMFIGWASNRKYRLLGALRGVAQTISYEISIALIFITIFFFAMRISLNEIYQCNSIAAFLGVSPLLYLVLLISIVAETNRTPFDFSEGESELVSGFNIEYGRGSFALIFMAEYGIILFFRIVIFTLSLSTTPRIVTLGIIAAAFWWVQLRATFPRYRYDKLMSLA